MKHWFTLVKQDILRLYHTRIIHLILILSFLFGMMLSIFPTIDPSNIFYLSMFILPVIVFAVSMYVEKEEQSVYPIACSRKDAVKLVLSKVFSSILVMMLPILFFILVLSLRHGNQIQFGLLILGYIVGASLHVLIGLFIAMANRTSKTLAASYITYVLVFSVTPILYANGIIPYSMQYIMIISPAYLSGVLIENILAGVWFSPSWLLILSAVLQVVYIAVLYRVAVIPHFCKYYLSTLD